MNNRILSLVMRLSTRLPLTFAHINTHPPTPHTKLARRRNVELFPTGAFLLQSILGNGGRTIIPD